jgi:hypothetical protein
MTLLVNSAAANLQRHAGGFHRGAYLAFRAFKRHMQNHFSMRFCINQQSQRILYTGAELNRLYPECSISMSNHAV